MVWLEHVKILKFSSKYWLMQIKSPLSFFLSLSTLWPRPQGINSRNCNMFISLDLPDEGFTINRKLAERCSSFTPNPFPDVISQVYISQTTEEWIKSLPRTVYGSTWRDSSLHSTSLQVLIPPSRTWGGDGVPRTTSLRWGAIKTPAVPWTPRWSCQDDDLSWMKVGDCQWIPDGPGGCPEDQTTPSNLRTLRAVWCPEAAS